MFRTGSGPHVKVGSRTDRRLLRRSDWLLVAGPAAALFVMTAILFWLHAVNADWVRSRAICVLRSPGRRSSAPETGVGRAGHSSGS